MKAKHTHTTIAAQAADLAAKRVSSVELTQAALNKAHANVHNAYLDVQAQLSLAQAQAADKAIAQGAGGKLTGIPIAHKDIFVTQGWKTTAGSKMLQGYVSPFDATVVDKLNAAGMVTIGKLNCDEFAMGSANENSFYGAVQNPAAIGAVPGGSSGGSAAAVAEGSVAVATGTDTGGSVRQPAAFCGVTGIKPTYGRASRYGMIAFASSLDQAGVIANTAQDCGWVLSEICGFDERDSTSLDKPAEDFCRLFQQTTPQASASKPLLGLRIGLPREYFADGVAAEVRDAIAQALKTYESLGAQCVELSLPRTDLAIPAYYVIAPAEASSNLSRFDGVRYGFRAPEYKDLLDMYEQTRAQGFGDEVKRRILVGNYVLSAGYYDAYYTKAQQLRRLIAQDFQAAFSQCDVIAGPIAPTVAWDLGQQNKDPVANYLADVFTLGASLAGLPAMSHPIGLGAQSQRPVGLHLIGNYFAEAQLLAMAHHFESV